ncbi:MAG: hypothetical protein PHE84_01760 [bacterium]|nr:hypothetical protein [bacterium]
MPERFELGSGILDWERTERVTDRYGFVFLVQEDEMDRVEEKVDLDQSLANRKGRLIALVRETRKSRHVGDLFHEIYPQTPEVGEEIVLGEGVLVFDDEGGVGVCPEDKRPKWWLNVRNLYRAHEQTVTLFFEEDPQNPCPQGIDSPH